MCNELIMKTCTVVTYLILALTVCTTSTTSASRLYFNSSIPNFIPDLTSVINVTCALNGSELIDQQDASNTTNDAIKYLTSLIVMREDNKPVASITEHTPAAVHVDMDNLEVKGEISGSSGFIHLSWTYPSDVQAGGYICETNGMTSVGHYVSVKDNLEIGIATPECSDLVSYIGKQQRAIDRLRSTVGNQGKTIRDQENEMSALKATNNAQENEIKSLLTKTSSQQNELSTIKTTNDAQENEISSLKTANNAQENEIKSLITKTNSQENEISTLKSTNDAQENEITSLRTVNNAQAQELSAVKSTNAAQEREISTIKATNNAQDREIANLRNVQSGVIDCGGSSGWGGSLSNPHGTHDKYTTKTVYFSKSYSRAPVVHMSTAFIDSDSDQAYFRIDLVSVTTSRFTMRCRNYYSDSIEDMWVGWVSIPQ